MGQSVSTHSEPTHAPNAIPDALCQPGHVYKRTINKQDLCRIRKLVRKGWLAPCHPPADETDDLVSVGTVELCLGPIPGQHHPARARGAPGDCPPRDST